MKLIIEKDYDGAELERKNRLTRNSVKVFDIECNTEFMIAGTYVVVDLKR